MIRSDHFRLPMARLALFAMLLLACLPTLGRLVGTSGEGSAGSVWAALCTMTGLKYVEVPAGDPAPQPHKPIHGEDCAYCPLLMAMAVFALWLALAWPQRRDAPRSAWRPAPQRSRFHPCGLGSRGPPLAL